MSSRAVATACGLCGHLPDGRGHRFPFHAGTANDAEGNPVPLCHEDDHSCYSRWLHGERPEPPFRTTSGGDAGSKLAGPGRSQADSGLRIQPDST